MMSWIIKFLISVNINQILQMSPKSLKIYIMGVKTNANAFFVLAFFFLAKSFTFTKPKSTHPFSFTEVKLRFQLGIEKHAERFLLWVLACLFDSWSLQNTDVKLKAVQLYCLHHVCTLQIMRHMLKPRRLAAFEHRIGKDLIKIFPFS